MSTEVIEQEGNLDPRIAEIYFRETLIFCKHIWEGEGEMYERFFRPVFGSERGFEYYICQRWNEVFDSLKQRDLELSIFDLFKSNFFHGIEAVLSHLRLSTPESRAREISYTNIEDEKGRRLINSFKKRVDYNFNLFDVAKGFQRMDIDEYDVRDQKWFLALKLATHSPIKSGLSQTEARRLMDQVRGGDRDYALRSIRSYIDLSYQFFSIEDLNFLLECAAEVDDTSLEEFDSLDFRISRQIEETMWKAQTLGMSSKHRKVLLSTIRIFERLYRNKFRRSEKNGHASEYSETGFNHILRTLDIAFGLLDAGDSKSGSLSSSFKRITDDINIESSSDLLELSMAVLTHDLEEDDLRDWDGAQVDFKWIADKLDESDVDDGIKGRTIKRSGMLNAKAFWNGEKPLESEDEGPSYGTYLLERIRGSSDSFLKLTKLADILQNASSSHRNSHLQTNPDTSLEQVDDSLRPGYKLKFMNWTDTFLSEYARDLNLLLGSGIKKNILRHNPQLLEDESNSYTKIVGDCRVSFDKPLIWNCFCEPELWYSDTRNKVKEVIIRKHSIKSGLETSLRHVAFAA